MVQRIVFMGTPDFSVPALAALHASGHQIIACYSQPPRPAGRGMELRKSPVHVRAEELGIPVFTPQSLKGETEEAIFRDHRADLAVVIAYGLLLPQAILDAPTHGCYNIHASLLPRWRGAAPIQRAIMAGDTMTGVMVMKMDAGLDTGPIAMVERQPISPEMNAGELHDRLSELGASLIVRAIAAIEEETLQLENQPEQGVTYASKLSKSETRIDWDQSAHRVHDHIRALAPSPGSWFEVAVQDRPERIKVLAAGPLEMTGSNSSVEPGTVLDDRLSIACGQGAVQLLRLQRAGRQPVGAEDFLRGLRLDAGTVLS
ncbi:MAG: methionyl-tRNA formyltransferase [Rhizobiaceae bacterium]